MIYEELYAFDGLVRGEVNGLVCGVDEAGRGPLCGPVCCAAVILREEDRFDGLNDSKKVSEKNRDRLFDEILAKAAAYSVVFVDNGTIDAINILAATMLGMRRAVEQLPLPASLALVDGNRLPDDSGLYRTVIKGDAHSASIAAASVLAKVSRDRFMRGLDVRYPVYGFAGHKGYPTKAHYAAIDAHGVTPFHRLSFLKGRV